MDLLEVPHDTPRYATSRSTTATYFGPTIETGVQAGAPKELEWYLAFGLMVTLVWLYISILKLLALLSRNR